MACVRRKDGRMRLCIDYRELNQKTHPERMIIPRISDIVDNLGCQRYFKTLDTSKACHEGYLEKDSRDLAAFITSWDLKEWLRILFGLTNAPPTAFQIVMHKCLSGLSDSTCIQYFNGILFYGKYFDINLE